MGLTEAATHKVGPLPAWGWGAIAVGGFVAWRMFGGKSGNGTTDAGVPSVGGGDTSGGGGGGGGSVDTSSLQAAIDSLVTKIGNITIPGTGGGSGGTTNPGGDTTTPAGTGGGGGQGILDPIIQPIQRAVSAAVPNTPQEWGAPISLAAPSQDTYVLAQQYYYALTHPGLPGYGGAAPDRSTLFTQDSSVMTEQLRQLLISVETSIGTTVYPNYTGAGAGMTDAFGNPYPAVPTSINEVAGFYREQVSPTSFVGQQYVDAGYPLNVYPDLPSANQSPSVVIAKLQADIVTVQGYINNLKAVPASQRTAAQNASLATYNDRLASFKQELTTQQKISQAINAGQVFNVADALASGGPPTVSNTPTQTVGTAAPSTAATPVDYSKAINTVQGYISNLSTVKNPTTAQKTELAMYQARLADYQSR